MSRYGTLTAVSAASRTTGFALKATPRPAAPIMPRSLAPSPTATVCDSGTPAACANRRSAAVLPSLSTIGSRTRPVSLPSVTSRVFAAT